jgi:hypothetical protein
MIEDELCAAGVVNLAAATDAQVDRARGLAEGQVEAALFLIKSNQEKYGRLVQKLANDYNKGRDCYPTTLTAAYELMLHDERSQDNRPHPHGNTGLNFHNNGTVAAATASESQPNPRPDVTCMQCDKTGHFANKQGDKTQQWSRPPV